MSATPLVWTGRILSGLVAAFLLFDAAMKIVKAAPVLEATEKLAIPADAVRGIGVLLLVCTVVYLIPQTAVIGAILLTGYLGGATAIHVRAGSGLFPVVFSLAFGVLAWLGLLLRAPQLWSSFLLRP